MIEENEVTCKICGEPTLYTETKLCSECWEMSTGFESLLRRKPEAAKDWLENQINELGYALKDIRIHYIDEVQIYHSVCGLIIGSDKGVLHVTTTKEKVTCKDCITKIEK